MPAARIFVACLVLVAACTDDPKTKRVGGGPLPSAGGASGGSGFEGQMIPCDVQRVLEAKCLRCHSDPPTQGAPFPLENLEDVKEMRSARALTEVMLRAVDSGFMPATYIDLDPPVEELTPGERRTLLDWLEDPDSVTTATCVPGEGGAGGVAGSAGAGE